MQKNIAPRESVALQVDLFTIEQSLHLLNKKFNNQYFRDILIHKIFFFKNEELDFYLPQICYLNLQRESKEMNKRLIERSGENMAFYFKINWYLMAYGDSSKDKNRKRKLEKLIQKCEEKIVNSLSVPSLNLADDTEKFTQIMLEKEARTLYITSVNKFITNLIKISLLLKSLPPEERKEQLKHFIWKANNILSLSRRKIDEKVEITHFFEGVAIPFGNYDKEKFTSNLLVRILDSEFTCFNTKKRVPYKIVIETVDIEDFKKFSPLEMSEPSSSTPSPLSFIEEEPKMFNGWEINELNSLDDSNKIHKYADLKDFATKIEKEEKSHFSQLRKTSFINIFSAIRHPKHKLLKFEESKEIIIERFSIPNSSKIQKIKDFNEKFKPLRIERRNSEEIRKNNDSDIVFKALEDEERIPDRRSYIPNRIIQKATQNLIPVQIKKKSGFTSELWEEKAAKIQLDSPYGHFPSYKLRSLIIKGGDDLRQEILAMQLIIRFSNIFKEVGLNLYLRPYEIIVTSANSGILEFVPDTMSIDFLKKKNPGKSLLQIYKQIFEYEFEEAQKKFIESLAAYSLICHLLQIKDRHNGNILIDAHGHIIHIDFGFIFTLSPGGINFENAPFKLTSEYVELMGGKNSNMFTYFKILILQGFMELRKHAHLIEFMLEIMMKDSDLPCFAEFSMKEFIARFHVKATDQECFKVVEKLIENSYDNWRTVQYDNFQKRSNGILP